MDQLAGVGTLLALGALALTCAWATPRVASWIRDQTEQAAALGVLLIGAATYRLLLPSPPGALASPLEHALHPELDAIDPWIAVVAGLWRAFGPSDAIAADTGALIGTGAVAATFWLGRRLGLDPRPAWIAAAVVATSATHLRFSHSDSDAVLTGALLTLGLAALAAPKDRAERLLAGVALGLAAGLRPEAIIALPLGLAVRAAAGGRVERDDALVVLGALPSAPAIAVAWSDGATWASTAWVPEARFLAAPTHTGLGVSIGVVAALAATSIPARVRAWALLWAALGTALAFAGPEQRYASLADQLVALPGLALLAAAGLDRIGAALVAHSRLLALGFGALVAATTPASLPAVFAPNVLTEEGILAREALAKVPPFCTILHHSGPGGTEITAPTRISQQLGLQHTWHDLALAPQPYGGCQRWYRAPSCYLHAGDGAPTEAGPAVLHPDCARAEQGLEIRSSFVRDLRSAPFGQEVYSTETAFPEVGLFEVSVPRDPKEPVPSAPIAPPGPDEIALRRTELTARIEALPPWTAPPAWNPDAVIELLESEPTCAADEVRCSSGLCVAISTDPDCDRSTWLAAKGSMGGIDIVRFTWSDEVEGFAAVAVTVIPASSRSDRDVQERVNAMARLLLTDALYP